MSLQRDNETTEEMIQRHLELALKAYQGRYGNGRIREIFLGKDYWPVQSWVNLFCAYGLKKDECKDFVKQLKEGASWKQLQKS